ncbi:hypothetical protein ASPSYDRAFT_844875 [Aspergillus sydowii CBS 593.65]|uniref:F-box domain-containing protein n=1 Tax=Aspergillus sydowii CBS 593.65 TaxID=1036612 RepID=A0A1L9SXT0_9EURO|nr:uncharacterized protein ASPSYDRAFT_844875 [Aspergillus sydowii CBS 593.65]OJJ51947.1 hypothetical protein ASPSYDRAFT_844875 [Aspergillus sydowii CBS 593.65]
MSFLSFPPELVLHTASTLHSGRDIYALVSVNRGLYQSVKNIYTSTMWTTKAAPGFSEQPRGSCVAFACFPSRTNGLERSIVDSLVESAHIVRRRLFPCMRVCRCESGCDETKSSD